MRNEPVSRDQSFCDERLTGSSALPPALFMVTRADLKFAGGSGGAPVAPVSLQENHVCLNMIYRWLQNLSAMLQRSLTHAGPWNGSSVGQGCFNPPPHQSSPTVSSRCSFCEKLCRGTDGRKFQKNDSGFVQNHKTVRVAATRRAGELTESTLTSRPASALKSERLHETSVKALVWFSGPPVVGSDLLRRGSPNKFWVVLWLEKTFFASNGFKVLGGFT